MARMPLSKVKSLVAAKDAKALSGLFWDWFCSDRTLPGRAILLAPSVLLVAEAMGYDPDATWVAFKNNCPAEGSLYDSATLFDGEEGDAVAWFAPKIGHANTPPDQRSEINVFGTGAGDEVRLFGAGLINLLTQIAVRNREDAR